MLPKELISEIIDDLDVAILSIKNLGKLTRPVLNSIERWYGDVDVVTPISELPLSDEKRNELILINLEEMKNHFTDEIEKTKNGQSLSERTHQSLASKVDPLWRELYSLHAKVYNAEFEALRPKNHEELNERVMMMEEMTGMNRQEIYNRSLNDNRLRKIIADLGLVPKDFNN